VLFDRFVGDAVARQTVPHPFPVLGEQPLSCARIEQLLVMARAMRLLGIHLQGAGKRRRMRARQHGQRRDPLGPAIGDDPGEAAAPVMANKVQATLAVAQGGYDGLQQSPSLKNTCVGLLPD
jgi:hypothetical protein